MTHKQRALFFASILFLAGGVYAVVDSLPGSGPADAVSLARDAQAAWAQQRTQDIIARRGWNGASRPPDAPGIPTDLPVLAGGVAALLAAAWLATTAMRRHRYL